MGLIQDIQQGTSQLVVGHLDESAKRRLAALHAASGVWPQADVSDRIRLARYILTGSEEERPETVLPTYPHENGDVLVLGPEVFVGQNEDGDDVICWQGVNFVRQDSQEVQPLTGVVPPAPDLVGPDPEAPGGQTDEDAEAPESGQSPVNPWGSTQVVPPDFEQVEPAPTAGAHWRGRRGGRDA